MRRIFLLAISQLFHLLNYLLLILALLFLMPIIVPYVANAKSYHFIQVALHYDQIIRKLVKASVPTVIAGKEFARIFMYVALVILAVIFSSIRDYFARLAEFLNYKKMVNNVNQEQKGSKNYELLEEKLGQIRSAKKRDREELLKEFIEIKKELDKSGRELAFLSVDVVDSTAMKQGEDPAVIEYDFKQYRRYVEDVLTKNNCLKSTWTPDGVMTCFTTIDSALSAAQDVIKGLNHFNKNVKTLKQDFAVRCGINYGFLYFDDSVPLEQISDRVIDIAGHMQKHAKPNTICIAKPSIEPLKYREGFKASGREVDGYEVYEWKSH